MITYATEEYQVDNADMINNHVNFVVTTENEAVLCIRLMDTASKIMYMRIFNDGNYDVVQMDKELTFNEMMSHVADDFFVEDVRVSELNAEVKRGK